MRRCRRMCPGIGYVEQTRVVCNVASCKYLPLSGNETKVNAVRERLRKERDINREKQTR